jgi:hypothetical protein
MAGDFDVLTAHEFRSAHNKADRECWGLSFQERGTRDQNVCKVPYRGRSKSTVVSVLD